MLSSFYVRGFAPRTATEAPNFFFFLKSIPLNGAERGATLVHSKYTKGRAKKKEKRRKIREGLRVLSKFMTTR